VVLIENGMPKACYFNKVVMKEISGKISSV